MFHTREQGGPKTMINDMLYSTPIGGCNERRIRLVKQGPMFVTWIYHPRLAVWKNKKSCQTWKKVKSTGLVNVWVTNNKKYKMTIWGTECEKIKILERLCGCSLSLPRACFFQGSLVLSSPVASFIFINFSHPVWTVPSGLYLVMRISYLVNKMSFDAISLSVCTPNNQLKLLN